MAKRSKEYSVFIVGEEPRQLSVCLNYRAKEGWTMKTCRRIRETPFELLVIMERRLDKRHKRS